MKLTRITGYALVLVFIAMSGALTGTALGLKRNPTPLVTTPPTGQWFDYVLNIMLENHSINFTYFNGGSVNSCIGNCTYFTSLANANGLALGLTNGNVNASTASYIAMTSGYGNAAQACNSGPNAVGCPYLQILNIVDRLESAGLTWKAYMEGYPQPPSGCFTNYNSGAPFYYTPNHNPFLYYADIVNSTARCARIVTANSQPVTQNSTGCWPSALQNDNVLINDLNSVTNASNYMWLTPNTLDQTHDCNDVSLGNAWLNKMVPQILSSTLFKTKRAALFITFDEPGCTNPAGQPPCPSPPSQDVYSVWASNRSNPTTRSSFKSTQSYLLYSPLKAVESNWGLSALTTNDATANSMSEFFAVLSASFTYSPLSIQPGQQITFTASATGGASPYTFNWRFGDGGTATGGTITHAYNTAGIYNAQLSVTDKLGAVKNTTQSITVGPNFSISSSPLSLTLHTGSSNASRIILSSINSFSGSVSLATSVSPSGLTASLNVTSVNLVAGGNATSTLTVSSTIPAIYSVNVTGTSGANSHTTAITVRVTTADFSISASPTSLTVSPSTNGTSMIQITSLNQFSGTVSLSASVSQPGLVPSLSPVSLSLSSSGSAASTLALSSVNYGNYTVTVTGVSGSLSHFATLTVRVFPVSVVVASDSASGTSSLYTTGGQKLIQDSAGKMISVYVDSSGRISLSYDNTDPSKGGWSAPVKSALPMFAYSWPAAVLVSLTSLRIIAVGGSVSGGVVDIPIAISRGSGNNVTGFSFGTATTLDSSGLGKYTAAILLHNNDILAAWGWENTTTSIVKSLRWDATTGWTSLSGSSTLPDSAFVDTSIIQYFVPNMIERPDNHNIYLFALRFVSSGRLAFDKASWNGSGWSWGSQNLTYETGASDADDDAIGLSWDPGRSLVVAEYGISGTHTYGVFTLTPADVKTHLDTPTLAVAGDRGWGAIGVQTNTGDYYLFLVSVNTDVGSGTLGYIRMPFGGSWNATITWLNAATDNQVTSLRAAGPSPSLDLLYVEGTTSPAAVRFVRLGAPGYSISPNPSSLSILVGSTATSTISLSSLYNFAGTVNLSVSVSPSGATLALTPTTVTLSSGSTSTSSLSLSPATAGVYTITILATNGILSQSTTVTVTASDFNIISNMSDITINAGATGTSTIIVTALNGLSGTVTLSASAPTPSGLSCALPASVTFGMSPQTATLSCTTTAAGTYTVKVTGTDGILSHQTGTISFVVVDFSISSGAASPSQILAGATGTSSVTITSTNGLTGSVMLSVSASTPVGLACTLTPTSVTFGNSPQISNLSCTSGTANTYTVTVTGTDGSLSHTTATITFVVVDFTITGGVTPVQILAGSTGTSTVAIGAVNGLTGTVSLTVSASTPAGLTCTISPMIATFGLSPQTATLTCSAALAGDYMVTVTGTSGSLAHTLPTVLFHIVDFSISAGVVSPTQILPDASGTSTISLAAVNGLTGTITLAVSTSTPSGLTCTLPLSVTLGGSPQTTTLSCSSSVAGNYTVTVTGTDGATSRSTPAILFVVVDFSIATAAVAPAQILAGSAGNSTVTVSSVNGFTGIVNLTANSTSCNLSTTVLASHGSSALSCSFTSAGTMSVVVTGTSGPLFHQAMGIFTVQDFAMTSSSSAVVVVAGSTGSSTIIVSSLNGFSGPVSLATNSTSCTLAPVSLTSPGNSAISCAYTSAGITNLAITGTSGSRSHSTIVTFIVQDYTMTSNPTTIIINAGTVSTSTITIGAVNGFSGTVSMTTNSTACTIFPVTITGSGNANLSCSLTSARITNIIVTSQDVSLSHTIIVSYVVQDFTLAGGSPVTSNVNNTSNSTVTAGALDQFSGTISLSENTSLGISCSPITPATIVSSGTASVSCNAASPGNYNVTITATSTNLVHSTTVTFIFQDYTIAAISPAASSILSPVAATFQINSENGFSAPVSVFSSPSLGLNCGPMVPGTVNGAGRTVVVCTSGLAGNYTLAITTNSTTLTHFATVTFTFGDFSIAASTPSPTRVGLMTSSTISILAINHYSGTVVFSDLVPAGLTCFPIMPISVTGSGTAMISCAGSSAGNYTIEILGTTGPLTRSSTVIIPISDYGISASSTLVTSNVGGNATVTINVTSLNGYSGTVQATSQVQNPVTTGTNQFGAAGHVTYLSPLTPGLGLNLNPSSEFIGIGQTGQFTLTLVVPAGMPVGNYTVNVLATDGQLSHTTQVIVVVTDFTFSTPTSILSISQGNNVTAILSLQSLNGFRANLTISSTINPAGPTTSLNPSSVFLISGANITLTINTPFGLQAGNYTLTVTAMTGSVLHTVSITLLVQSGTSALLAGLRSNGTATTGIAGLLTLLFLLPYSIHNNHQRIRRRKRQEVASVITHRSTRMTTSFSTINVTSTWLPVPVHS